MFPTKHRATAYGISAAVGKLGAVISQVGFSKLRDVGGKDPDNKNEFLGPLIAITTIFMVIGLISTWYFLKDTEVKPLDADDEKPVGQLSFVADSV